jgi:hypothetical protein
VPEDRKCGFHNLHTQYPFFQNKAIHAFRQIQDFGEGVNVKAFQSFLVPTKEFYFSYFVICRRGWHYRGFKLMTSRSKKKIKKKPYR